MLTNSRSHVRSEAGSGSERENAIRLIAIPRRRRKEAGKNIIQGDESITLRASESIEPREGMGTGTPQPRKESVASPITAERKDDTLCIAA